MTTITFADHELKELKNFYQIELTKSIQKVEDIKNILNKIGGETQQNQSIQSEQKDETAINPIVSKDTPAQSKPRRRKNKNVAWSKFIPKLLKREDRYLTMHDITQAAMEKFNLTDRVKVLRIVSTTLARMQREGILKSERKEGQQNKYYGLTSWSGKEPEISTKKIAPDGAIIETKERPIQNQLEEKHKSKKIVIPWKKFIPQQIKENGSLTIYDFADIAIKKFHYPNREKLIRTLSPTLSRMLKIGKLTFDRKPGQKTHLYGLPSIPAKVKGSNGTAVALS